MNNIDIDALSGRELDVAVALELGWRWMILTHKPTDPYISLIAPNSFHTFAPYGHFATDVELASDLDKSEGSCPHYSADIAAAWELDGEGEGWDWQIIECSEFGRRIVEVLCDCPSQLPHYVKASVTIADFPTKSEAYATARCRAWLKAKYAERLCEHGFTTSCPEGCN